MARVSLGHEPPLNNHASLPGFCIYSAQRIRAAIGRFLASALWADDSGVWCDVDHGIFALWHHPYADTSLLARMGGGARAPLVCLRLADSASAPQAESKAFLLRGLKAAFVPKRLSWRDGRRACAARFILAKAEPLRGIADSASCLGRNGAGRPWPARP